MAITRLKDWTNLSTKRTKTISSRLGDCFGRCLFDEKVLFNARYTVLLNAAGISPIVRIATQTSVRIYTRNAVYLIPSMRQNDTHG